MKQFSIIFASALLASPVLSAPAAAHPHLQQRQDSTITYTRVPLSSGIPSITDSYSPAPTNTLPFSSTLTTTKSSSFASSSSSSASSSTSPSPTPTHSSLPSSTISSVTSSTKIIPTSSSTPPNSVSVIPTSSYDGGLTIDNSRTLSFPGGQTRTYIFGGQTVTLTFPGSPMLTFAAEANPAREIEKRQLLPLTDGGRSLITQSILPATTVWDNGGPVLTLPGSVGATDIPNVQLTEGEEERMVEVIKRQTDTITFGGTLPVTTYWGDRTITIGGQTLTFGDVPGGPGMSLTLGAGGARVTGGLEGKIA